MVHDLLPWLPAQIPPNRECRLGRFGREQVNRRPLAWTGVSYRVPPHLDILGPGNLGQIALPPTVIQLIQLRDFVVCPPASSLIQETNQMLLNGHLKGSKARGFRPTTACDAFAGYFVPWPMSLSYIHLLSYRRCHRYSGSVGARSADVQNGR